jgi:uncharacterized protein YfaQ (DUF2300 family)
MPLGASTLDVAYIDSQSLRAFQISEKEQKSISYKELKTPFGSLWKLLAHIYFLENGETPAPYICEGKKTEEVFCCEKGKSIRFEDAISKSCGLFYEDKLKMIRSSDWKLFWDEKKISYAWLAKSQLLPSTLIPVEELLAAFGKISSFKSFNSLKDHLFSVMTKGTLAGHISEFGSNLFIKTWTWENQLSGQLIGGAAGWTREGIPFWIKGDGSSKDVFKKFSSIILDLLPKNSKIDGTNVTVNFFKKYPIQRVLTLPDKKEIKFGRLIGNYLIEFKNGNRLQVVADGKLNLALNHTISGSFTSEDYVARVLEREGDVHQPEAAKALSIIIRTYLYKHAKKNNQGLEIDDSTLLQRVSPSTAGAQAMNLTGFTNGMILHDDNVHYSTSSWQKMRQLAAKNMRFNDILSAVFPGNPLKLLTDKREDDCSRIKLAENYLMHSLKKWRKTLDRHPGYEEIRNVHVCQLRLTKPFSDLKKNRIYLNFDESLEARITLAHEYLHLGFKHHPATQDEVFIEQLAQQVTGVPHD